MYSRQLYFNDFNFTVLGVNFVELVTSCFDENVKEKTTNKIPYGKYDSKELSKIMSASKVSTNSFDLFNKYWRDKGDDSAENKQKFSQD